VSKREVVAEGIKSGNTSETCPRYGIAPTLYHRWKDEAGQGAKAALGGVAEKDVVLAIANAATEELKASGIQVTQTRTGDVSDSENQLQWRLKQAEGSDILVSIHANWGKDPTAAGFEVFYKPGSESSKALAESISASNTVFRHGRVTQEGLYVLRKFSGTGVLVEAGFISNEADRGKLQSQPAKIGKEIGQGIVHYLKKE
jgi:N-acetylmuramoyl-L-alanine amidase